MNNFNIGSDINIITNTYCTKTPFNINIINKQDSNINPTSFKTDVLISVPDAMIKLTEIGLLCLSGYIFLNENP